MASKKDMRRQDLIVPYVPSDKKEEGADFSGTMSSTLPMAAIFTRNKMIGWTATIMAVQSWLSETPAQRATAATPGYFSVGMAAMSVLVCYMPLFLPPSTQPGAGTVTGAPPPAAL